MNITKTLTRMVERRVKFGANKMESADLLRDLLAAHKGDNLVHALCYEGFATELQATRLAKYLAS